MRIALVFCCLIVISSNTAFCQEEIVKEIFQAAFYDDRLYDRIFFEYKGDSSHTFYGGYTRGMKAVFVLPDENLAAKIPNLVYRVADSWGNEKHISTMTFVKTTRGNIFLSNNIGDINIGVFVDFDEFTIKQKKAKFTFHTESVNEAEHLRNRYIKVVAELNKKRNGWKVKRLNVMPNAFEKLF